MVEGDATADHGIMCQIEETPDAGDRGTEYAEKMIGTGHSQPAASIKDRICVLSPISARLTTVVERRITFYGVPSGSGGR